MTWYLSCLLLLLYIPHMCRSFSFETFQCNLVCENLSTGCGDTSWIKFVTICKINTSICSWLLLNVSYLIQINKVQSSRVYLKSTTYNFFDKFSYCIKKNNKSKYFRVIIQSLVRLWNNDWCQLLKMRRPIAKINAWICYINNISNIFIIA